MRNCVLIDHCDLSACTCCQLIWVIIRAALYCSTFKDVYCGSSSSSCATTTSTTRCFSCLVSSCFSSLSLCLCTTTTLFCCGNCKLTCHVWVNNAMVRYSLSSLTPCSSTAVDCSPPLTMPVSNNCAEFGS